MSRGSWSFAWTGCWKGLFSPLMEVFLEVFAVCTLHNSSTSVSQQFTCKWDQHRTTPQLVELPCNICPSNRFFSNILFSVVKLKDDKMFLFKWNANVTTVWLSVYQRFGSQAACQQTLLPHNRSKVSSFYAFLLRLHCQTASRENKEDEGSVFVLMDKTENGDLIWFECISS